MNGMNIFPKLILVLQILMIQSTKAFMSYHDKIHLISNHVDKRSKAKVSFEKKIGNDLYHLKAIISGTGEEVDWDWEKVQESVFEGEDKRPVILFDGICNLCNGGVNFALDHDEVGHFRFASLQSQIGKSLLIRANKKSSDLSSIVLIDKDEAYFKSEAVIRIAKKLEFPIPILAFLAMFIPNFIRNIFYEFVSNNRHRFGITEDSCRLEDEQFDSRFIPDPSNNKDEL